MTSTITAAMREAAYQALVKRGVPIPPNEIDAALEAAEGARVSDARPAPMAEEVKQALDTARADHHYIYGMSSRADAADTLSAHIDDLTRLNATLRERLYADLSRPQETDAVLAEREACARIAEACKTPPLWEGDLTDGIAAAIRSRPSTGPATETDVTPAMVHAALAAFNGNWQLPYGAMRDALKAALLTSVRLKAEGV